ncbi:hypothetical protein Q5P01_016594 [Channa striata]|uniref:Uncharacterized protein n=1 Tax=Channa striata TaxID=64152 RepID=A0AA88M8E5_CHASR|nr:hypothetical protein Q5P01_016594 [Channa striata]
MTSSTLALSFAACGLRPFAPEAEAPDSAGSGVVVTVAGLLYFAAWYVLVYASALHAGPAALRAGLCRGGTDAERPLCGALKLVGRGSAVGPGEADGDLSCGYSVRDYRDRDVVRALLIVFEGLLDARTVLRAAQLYVPELTAQLPYLRALGKMPDSVGSAIEARDVWLETLRGGSSSTASRDKDDEPPFVYVGDVAHGQHSSVRGALFKGDSRPVAGPPPSHDDRGFDPWFDCLLIADPEHELMKPEPGSSDVVGGDGWNDTAPDLASGEYITQKLESMTIQDVNDVQGDIYVESACNADEPAATRGQFSSAKDDAHLGLTPERGSSIEAPQLKRPCIANIAHTVYTKTAGTETGGTATAGGEEPRRRYRVLAEELWALLVGTHEASVEPCSVEALVVMMHLAVKSFELTGAAKLGPCNDVKALRAGAYGSEEKFVPVAAIAGGLFGINIQICAAGHVYRVVNFHHGNRWPVGFLEYSLNGWSLRNLPVGYSVRRPFISELDSEDCYHKGTYRAYARLNGLRVVRVDSDGYCGFHAVTTLMAEDREMCNSERRREVARRTAAFLFRHRQRSDIENYLTCNELSNAEDLETLLTTNGRWLDVQELGYMLEVHSVVREPRGPRQVSPAAAPA